MNRHVSFLLALFLLLVASAPVAHAEEDPGHQLVGLLDYVAADYPRAVRDGEVIDEFEFEEMKELSSDAASLVNADADAPQKLGDALDALGTAVDEKRDPAAVEALSRKARDVVIAHYDVQLFPTRAPSLPRGRELYRSQCASCHGDDGAAATEVAETLKPAPANFTDPEVRAGLSPYRVFNTTTFGIEGTSMIAYDSLSESDRWNLAFYVLALGHGGAAERANPELPAGFRPTIRVLASARDVDLAQQLEAAGAATATIDELVSDLRTVSPYQLDTGRGFAVVYEHLDAAEASWTGGDFVDARQEVLTAYLEGFEPLESELSAVDSDVTEQLEETFFELRDALESEDTERADSTSRELREKLEDAELMLAQGSSAWAIGVASATIAVREGVEIVLLLALLLGLLERSGRREGRKYVHGGWIAAVVAGIATWFAASMFIEISGIARELVEGIVALIAAAILFTISYWFIGNLQGERWQKLIATKIEDNASAGRLLSLAAVAFFAVYREAFEVVLFYQALILQAEGNVLPVFYGIGVAAVILAVFALAVFRLEMRLPLKPFFALSAAALYAICIVLVGNGLHALVEAGWLAPMPLEFPKVSWLGVYPETIGLLSQGALTIAGLVWAVVLWMRSARSEQT